MFLVAGLYWAFYTVLFAVGIPYEETAVTMALADSSLHYLALIICRLHRHTNSG